jgi:hypothetical protein
VRLDTALSGAHVGPDGIAALRRQIDELTAGTWRPLREDSFDIATSRWHAVIMEPFGTTDGNPGGACSPSRLQGPTPGSNRNDVTQLIPLLDAVPR